MHDYSKFKWYGAIICICLSLCGCEAIGILILPDLASGTYNAAFQIKIEDVSALSNEEQHQLREIQMYASGTNLTYTSIRQVEGLSCGHKIGGGDASKEDAMMQLKIKALKASGNAVLFSECSHHSRVDWGNNCFESWVCKGEVVNVE
jgi:hypothetical protein